MPHDTMSPDFSLDSADEILSPGAEKKSGGVMAAFRAAKQEITSAVKHVGAKAILSALMLAAVAVGAPRKAEAQSGYTVTSLGSYEGTAINDSGQVAGTNNANDQAFLYTNGTFTNLGTLGGSRSFAGALNNSAEVVGSSDLTGQTTPYYAFVYENGVMTNIYSSAASAATAVNNPGQVAGYYTTTSGGIAAFFYTNGAAQTIPSLENGFQDLAFGINDSGLVVGYSDTPAYTRHAFLYNSNTGSIQDIGTLSTYGAWATAINNNGQIVGTSFASASAEHAFFYNNGVMTDIGTLGGTNSVVYALNNSGAVVGFSNISSGTQHAFIYQNGVMTDLNALVTLSNGSYLENGAGINDSGQIVATGGDGNTYLLTPTEPAKTLGGIGCGCDATNPQPNTTGQIGNGDPINPGTGNVVESVTDYATVGQNPLSFTRSYNSMQNLLNPNTQATTLGVNWRSNYDRYLNIVSSTTVTAERADGQVIAFTGNGSGTWTTDTDVDMTLTQAGTTYTLTDHNQTVEVYTASGTSGTLNTITLRNGYEQTLNRTGGKLTSVTDSYGRSLGFTYYGNGMLETVTTPDTLVLTYGFTAATGGNQLTSVSYNTSPVTSLTYQYTDASFPFALTGVLDEKGQQFSNWTYDSLGRGTSSERGGTALGADYTQVTYNSNGTTTVTNAFGVADMYSFTTLQGVPKLTQIDRAATSTTAAATETFGYDTNGYLNSKTDWNGNQTTYTNDTHGDPTTINYAVGSPVAYSVGIQYDTPNFPQLPEIITAPGVTSTYNRDGNGNPLSRTDVDTTTTTVPYSTNGQSRETQWTWTSTGQEKSVQLPRTDVTAKTTFGYTGGTLTSITDALGHETQITQYTNGGLPKTIIDPNNVTTTDTYDLRLNLHTSTLTTTAGPLTTTWTYDPANELQIVQQPDGSQLTYGYDTAHRLTSVADLLGNTTTYTLDALGGATLTNVTNSSSTVTRTNSAVFDALDRMTSYIGGQGQTTIYGYDPMSNVTNITPPAPSGAISQTFDALNRLSTHVDPAPGGTTTTTYNTFNFPLTVQDANSNTTSYVYNGFNDRIETASPDSGTSVFYYNGDRDLTKSVLPGSLTMNATFDADDRLLTRAYTGDTTLNVSNTYDQTTGHGFGVGRLTSATDQVGSLSLTYDERGNITNEVRTPTSLSALNTSTTYDAASNVSSITYPSGNLVTYGRNSMGEVTSITSKPSGASTATNIAMGVTYEPLPEFAATGVPPVTGLTFGNGVAGTYTYDLDYRPTGRLDAGTATVQKLGYTYYTNDSVKKITDFVNASNTQTLNYNAVDELTSATSGTGGYGTYGFTWDPVGNLKTETVNGTGTTFNHPTTSNRLSSFKTGTTTETVTTSASGNITKFAISGTAQETLTYNKANELASAATTAQSSSYAFDEFGKRLKSVGTATGTSTFQYDDSKSLSPGSNLLTDTDGAGNSRVDYIYLNGRPLGTYQPSNNQFYFISTDRLGTPSTVTDSTQTVQWSATYQPFGNTSTGASGIVQNLRLPGQEWDLESTFNHNGFRDYAATLTRYIQTDPIGLAGGMNTYQYANGNPFKYTDPKGLDGYGSTVGNLIGQYYENAIRPNGYITVGFGGSAHIILFGAGASSSFGMDTNGNMCFIAEACTTFGIGVSGGIGAIGSVGSGSLCEGTSHTGGLFLNGGAGIYGGGTVSRNTPSGNLAFGTDPGQSTGANGISGGKGIVGAGGGIAGGFQSCTQSTVCFNPFLLGPK